jgi:hypothetical protein
VKRLADYSKTIREYGLFDECRVEEIPKLRQEVWERRPIEPKAAKKK